MNREKTNLLPLRNVEWRTHKTETNKINYILPYISTYNITDLNELIYAGAKLVCEKIGIPLISTKKQSKPGWEIRLETQIKNLRNQAKMLKQKDPVICRNRMEKTTREKNNNTTWGNKPESSGKRREIKEISTKGKTIQNKTGYSKTTKENSTNNWEDMTQKHTNNRTPKKPNTFGRKYDDQNSITKKLNG